MAMAPTRGYCFGLPAPNPSCAVMSKRRSLNWSKKFSKPANALFDRTRRSAGLDSDHFQPTTTADLIPELRIRDQAFRPSAPLSATKGGYNPAYSRTSRLRIQNGSTLLAAVGNRGFVCAVLGPRQLFHRAHRGSGRHHTIWQVSSRRRAGIELEAALLRYRDRHREPARESDHFDHGDENKR